MTDLNIVDLSIKLFSLDQPKLIFQIKPNNNTININVSNSNTSHNPINIGQTSITVSNLSSEYLAFRTKTTKKQYYSVYPSYCIIAPNGKEKIDFSYYIKEGEKVSEKGHKFRFEGFVISSDEKDIDPRALFSTYISQKTPVKGTIIKSDVKFIENEINTVNTNIDKKIVLPPLSTTSLGFLSEKSLPHAEESSISKDNLLISSGIDKNKISEKTVEKPIEKHNDFGTPKIKKYIPSNKRLNEFSAPKTEEENNALLNNLKVEYYKLKNELDNLKNNYYNLRNHVDLEENNEEDIKEDNNTKDNYPSINSKEIKLSQPICIALFIIGIIAGFYLS